MRTRIFTLLFCAFIGTVVQAQNPEGVFKKASVAPVIDGVIDAVWAEANVYNIDKNFQSEVPTLGAAGETTWQALWTPEGIYVLLKVTDDVFYPNYAVSPAGNNWEYDKPEIYFDVNAELKDGIGPSVAGSGHIQVAPGFTDGKNDGTPFTQTDGVVYAFMVTDPNYIGEYFIPFSKLVDKDGIEVDKTATIGFDVTIIDRDAQDPVRQRAVWANVGAINESYSNMDDCGHVTFEGAEEAILVDAITVAPGTISVDNGTLQMTATIMPVDATNQKLKWTVENGTGSAKISAPGILTALTDGTVTVKAASTDGGFVEGTAVVTISGQVISADDIWNNFNLISNWNFTDDTSVGGFPIGWSGWVDTGNMNPPVANPTVVDGVCVMQVGLATDAAQWHYQFNQSPLAGEPDVPYTLKFKSWADVDGTPCAVDFEDIAGNNYNRYGTSTDPEAVIVGTGSSEWHYTVNMAPAWFTFHVVFDQIVSNTVQKIQWMNSLSNANISLDSILLVKDSQLVLSAKDLNASSNKLKVYPNPVGNANILNVYISKADSKVAIYNAVGQKIMENIANGNLAKFNVGNLNKGIYFVRLEDGTSQKFLK
jgi:uncharacterized protein YjdB